MSSRNEKKTAKLREEAAAAEIEINRLLKKAARELEDERDKRLRREAGLPLSYKHAEEEQAEEERIKRKSKTPLGRLKSIFKIKSRSRSPSPPPPPAYNTPSVNAPPPPPAYTPRSRGGTKRGKKTRRNKIYKKKRTLLKRRK